MLFNNWRPNCLKHDGNNMNKLYPDNVINKILQITLETQTFAYLSIDDQGVLKNQGGNMQAMGMHAWSIGENVLDDALFLSGLIPMSNSYEYMPSVQVTDESIVDIHLFQDHDCNWVILVDKTDELEWQSQARQKSNELRLLQQQLDSHREGDTSQAKTSFEFFEALNMMALQKNKDGSFELLKPVSEHFKCIYPEPFDTPESLFPQHKFIFIENFLIDAQQLWDSEVNQRRIASGPWIELTAEGEEVALEAIALNWDGRNLLFIEILEENYQQHHDFLQIGREGILSKNVLEMEVRKRTREIRAREEEIALRLVCAADTRDDGETGSHIQRLGMYCEVMAKYLGWNQEAIDEIRIAAPMHDIGKIGIPDYILRKPGKLTTDEFEIMKLHTEIGGRILSNSQSELVQMAMEISVGHHEKWDGSGYPHGLSGEAIPVCARIVAIVDVFDALMNKRVYKDSMTVEQTMEIMHQDRGKHFDPQLFDLFIEHQQEMIKIATSYIDPICTKLDICHI